ncbi:MAG: DegT/DnrJ/EryC1/StrS family aminotransferase [Gammaproteobacteria bacterium]|nr:DegT/DnrJ/EryC1/StrS family aminotransferase [Gammaproteobacteria bacterium]
MFYQLPPVGSPICLEKSIDLADIEVFSSYQTQFYASGTAALAAAVIAALDCAKRLQEPGDAEIILPAYGCPDLVSAVVFAGAKPVLVDFEEDRPWLDLSLLSSSITKNTVAIVAVNLFGITERWAQLREITSQNNLILIEDSAQYFPDKKEPSDWQGDLVVLSFGRGKPVSLLGGGAVITKSTSLYRSLPQPDPVPETVIQRLLFSLKSRIYNTMISPFLYWIPQALPFLRIGETRYHNLLSIGAMDRVRLSMLGSNIYRYQNDIEAISRCEKISSMLDSLDNVNNLPMINNTEVKPRLLRYPLLVEGVSRNSVYQTLRRAGLGASIMYPAILPKIVGMEFLSVNNQGFPNAEAFASRLITLPTHSYLGEEKLKKIKTILGNATH